MLTAGYKPATPATKRTQTYVLDSAATGIGLKQGYTERKMEKDT
jgi:hypothetical protein